MQNASQTSFRERLKAAIDESGLQNQVVARIAGLSPSAITLWLNGDTKSYKADPFLRVCQALDVRPQWLLWGDGPMREARDSLAVVELINTMPPDSRQRVLDFAEYDLTKSVASDPRKLGSYLRLIDRLKSAPRPPTD